MLSTRCWRAEDGSSPTMWASSYISMYFLTTGVASTSSHAAWNVGSSPHPVSKRSCMLSSFSRNGAITSCVPCCTLSGLKPANDVTRAATRCADVSAGFEAICATASAGTPDSNIFMLLASLSFFP